MSTLPPSSPRTRRESFADGFTVSYALSGTLYAHLRRQPKATGRGLLALADPVFQTPAWLITPNNEYRGSDGSVMFSRTVNSAVTAPRARLG